MTIRTKTLYYVTLFGYLVNIIRLMPYGVCTIEEGSNDAASVVPAPSETLGSAEQGGVLQQAGDDVQVKYDKADTIPSVGIEEERDTATLEWKREPGTTTAVPSKTRSRTRWFFAAKWKGAKRLLLCGCYRRN